MFKLAATTLMPIIRRYVNMIPRKYAVSNLRIILTQNSRRRRDIRYINMGTLTASRRECAHLRRTRACADAGENGRGTHEFVASRSNRKFVSILRGNPRNPRINIHGPPCLSPPCSRVNSILPCVSCRCTFRPILPSFFFIRSSPLTSFLFRARKTFSLSQRKCATPFLGLSAIRLIFFFFSVVLNIRKRSRVLTPDRLANPIYAASDYFYFPLRFESGLIFHLLHVSLFSLLVHRILNGIALRFRIFNIQRLIIEKLRGNYRIIF